MFPIELQNYIQLENAIVPGIDRLLPESSVNHAEEITRAIDRIYAVLVRQNPTFKQLHRPLRPLIKIDPRERTNIDFNSFKSMFHAEISTYESEIESYAAHGLEFSGGGAGYRKEISLQAALEKAKMNILLDRFLCDPDNQENVQINELEYS